MYDAILVDEGQDFKLSWWQTLRKALEPNGEMLLVADKTQNVYGTAADWTEKAMVGAGFSGPWKELKDCYRLPNDIIPVLRNFAHDFLLPSGEEVDLPTDPQLQFEFESQSELRWVQVRSEQAIGEVCFDEVRRQMKDLQEDTAIPDVIFLASSNRLGREFVKRCKQKNIRVIDTFENEDRESRESGLQAGVSDTIRVSHRKKLSFFLGDARVKATTLHSFKGWEARNLVVHVSSFNAPEDRALFYTALTRLKGHCGGSKLTVVSSSPDLHKFGRANFPDFTSW